MGGCVTLAIFDKPDPLDGPYLRRDDLRDAGSRCPLDA